MPTPEILQKLKNYLATSQSFACLAESEQANYLAKIEQADDEQLVYIMQLMEQEDKKYLEEEQARLEQGQKQVELAETISKEIRDSKKVVQQAKEEADQSQSEVLLSQMEDQLKPDSEAEQHTNPPRKKFLGLF